MGCWEPLITDEQFESWMESFHARHGGSPYEVLNAAVPSNDAAYAEAYAAWLAGGEIRRKNIRTGVL